jgi:hypothetical protein
MNLARVKLGFTILSCALLSACGSPGAPLPPSLELARPVTDLRAIRKGNVVTLTWTAPAKTTDGHNIRHFGVTEICRASQNLSQCGKPLVKLPGTKPNARVESDISYETYNDQLSPTAVGVNAEAKLFYALQVFNSYGRTAGLSNQVEVPAVPTLAPPQNFSAQLSAQGVRLTWTAETHAPSISGMRFACRIYRREANASSLAVIGEFPVEDSTATSFLDSGMEWEKTYKYHATIVTTISQSDEQVEGDDGTEIEIFVHDTFPPAVPSGLQAVFSGPGQKPFIDLVWAPDTDADLAGYNVYRSENGEATKLNSDLIKSPAFRDTDVVAGHEYTYAVSAIDVRGNESARSEVANEKVPAE